MRTAFPVQELPVRSALTVAANCVNRTRKHAASVTAYSVLRACPSIRNTRRQPQRITASDKNAEVPDFCRIVITFAANLRGVLLLSKSPCNRYLKQTTIRKLKSNAHNCHFSALSLSF